MNDILYRKWESVNKKTDEYKIVLPLELRKYVLQKLHNKPSGGHLGIMKTMQKVRQRFFWYGLARDVKKWCKICDVCASRKMPHKKIRAAMKLYNVGASLERVALDIMGPLPKIKKGNKYILVISDYFTKWVEAVPIKNQAAVTVARKFIDHFVTKFGVPMQIHSDRGACFDSEVFKEMCNILGSEKTRTTAMRPQSDGLVERANRTLQNMLSNYVSENQTDWDQYLSILTMAYNSSVHESTGFSPSCMMYGRDKRKYDHNIEQKLYNVGDAVWYYYPICKKGRSRKLQRPWTGPYIVTKRINNVIYKIKLTAKSKAKIVHHDRLKPYLSDSQPSWFRPEIHS